MGVSKNSGTPKWMVYYKGKPYEQMDDLGGKNPLFLVQYPTVDGWNPGNSPVEVGSWNLPFTTGFSTIPGGG